MGNNSSTFGFESHIASKDYKPIKKIKDRQFGEVTIMKNNKSDDTVLMKTKLAPDSETYHRIIENCTYHASLKHPNLATIYGFTGADTHELFKDASHKICVYFEYLPTSLESILQKKRIQVASNKRPIFGSPEKTSNYFGEHDLMRMMTQLVTVLEYLQQNSVSHGDIKPESIFVTNNGSLKVINRKVISDEESVQDKLRNDTFNSLVTPPAFECLGKNRYLPMEDRYKADVFSLGMIMLECATLKKSSQIYDWNNYTLNLNLLSGRIVEVKQNYSQNFYELLRAMLQFEEFKRPDFILLKQYVNREAKPIHTTLFTQPAEDEMLLKDLILTTDPKNTSMGHTHLHNPPSVSSSFGHKPSANHIVVKPESKQPPVGETPLLTREVSISDIGIFTIPSLKEEDLDEDEVATEVHSKFNKATEQTMCAASKKDKTPNKSLRQDSLSQERVFEDKISKQRHETKNSEERPYESETSFCRSDRLIKINGIPADDYLKSLAKGDDKPFATLTTEGEEIRALLVKPQVKNPTIGTPFTLNNIESAPSKVLYTEPAPTTQPIMESPVVLNKNVANQMVQDVLERARKCRESLYRSNEKLSPYKSDRKFNTPNNITRDSPMTNRDMNQDDSRSWGLNHKCVTEADADRPNEFNLMLYKIDSSPSKQDPYAAYLTNIQNHQSRRSFSKYSNPSTSNTGSYRTSASILRNDRASISSNALNNLVPDNYKENQGDVPRAVRSRSQRSSTITHSHRKTIGSEASFEGLEEKANPPSNLSVIKTVSFATPERIRTSAELYASQKVDASKRDPYSIDLGKNNEAGEANRPTNTSSARQVPLVKAYYNPILHKRDDSQIENKFMEALAKANLARDFARKLHSEISSAQPRATSYERRRPPQTPAYL